MFSSQRPPPRALKRHVSEAEAEFEAELPLDSTFDLDAGALIGTKAQITRKSRRVLKAQGSWYPDGPVNLEEIMQSNKQRVDDVFEKTVLCG